MKIGCSIVPGEAKLARQCGFSYVELAGKRVQRMRQEEFHDLQAELEEAQISCYGFNAYCPEEIKIAGPNFSEDAARRYAEELLVRAKALGVQVVGVGSPFSRRLPEGFDTALADEQAKRFFICTGEVFAQAGIQVCIEALAPCYCNYINHVSHAYALAEAAGLPNVGVVADFYNMEWVDEADIDLRQFQKRLFHIHLSDDDGSPNRRDFLKAEKASIHQKRIQTLCNTGYTGRLTIEVDLPVTLKKGSETLDMLHAFR